MLSRILLFGSLVGEILDGAELLEGTAASQPWMWLCGVAVAAFGLIPAAWEVADAYYLRYDAPPDFRDLR